MREVKIKLYQYSELSETAKEAARDWWRSVDDGSDAWDNVREDAAQVCIKIHVLSDTRANQGGFTNSALDTAKRILENHGAECETFKTATHFLGARDAAAKHPDEDARADVLEELEHEFLAAILEDYRVYHKKEVEYHDSEEYIAEVMEANEYEFTKDGKRFTV